jgi:hypothetical protein
MVTMARDGTTRTLERTLRVWTLGGLPDYRVCCVLQYSNTFITIPKKQTRRKRNEPPE